MEERGRPSVMTEEVIAKLEQAFLNGASDMQAAFVAGIGARTLYDYCAENPEFADRKEALKEQVKYRAKMNIAKAVNEGDKTLSQWYLERRDPEFKPKQEQDNKGQITVEVISFGAGIALTPETLESGLKPLENIPVAQPSHLIVEDPDSSQIQTTAIPDSASQSS